ncbi:MAG: hypothetical protein FJX77_08605 [Armatimonadetes bacterium]|nr:hypothetical protein [Armatimonadota bacterium]
MSYVVRFIRKSRWQHASAPSWLPQGEPTGDCLNDLRTTENKLSVWLIENDPSNLDRVLAAFAATRDSTAPLDYRRVSLGWIQRHRLSLLPTSGDSPDQEANHRWHRDLSQLSATGVAGVQQNQLSRDG